MLSIVLVWNTGMVGQVKWAGRSIGGKITVTDRLKGGGIESMKSAAGGQNDRTDAG